MAGEGPASAGRARGRGRARTSASVRRAKARNARAARLRNAGGRGARGAGAEADLAQNPFRRGAEPVARTNRVESDLTTHRTGTESDLVRRSGGRAAGVDLSSGRRVTRGHKIRTAVAGFFVAGLLAASAVVGGHVISNVGHWPTGTPPPISTTQGPGHPGDHPTVPVPGGHSGGGMPTPGHPGGGSSGGGTTGGNNTPDPGQNTPVPTGQGGAGGSHGGPGGTVHPAPTPTHTMGVPGSHSSDARHAGQSGGLRRP